MALLRTTLELRNKMDMGRKILLRWGIVFGLIILSLSIWQLFFVPREYVIIPPDISPDNKRYQEIKIPEEALRGILVYTPGRMGIISEYHVSPFNLEMKRGWIQVWIDPSPSLKEWNILRTPLRNFINRKVEIRGKILGEGRERGIQAARIRRIGILYNAYKDLFSFFFWLYQIETGEYAGDILFYDGD